MADESAATLLDQALKRLEEQGQASVLPTQTQTRRELGVPAGKPLTFTERNYGGFPIDVESGAPGWVRFGVAAREKPEEKLGFLADLYGKGMVRRADNGEYLVKVLDETTSKPKELLVNEEGVSMGDLSALAAHAPETAGAIIGMRLGRNIPKLGAAKGLLGTERNIVAAAVGQEVAGAGKDVATRLQDDNAIDAAEIIRRRELNLPFDIAMGNAMGIVGKGVSKLITPLGPPMAGVDAEANAARSRLAASTGVEIPKSVGEATGSQVFKRVEATAAQLPGSSKYFSQLLEEKTAALRSVMNKIMGLSDEVAPGTAIPSSESIGEASVAHIKSKLTPVQEAIEAARNTSIKQANQQVLDTLADATGPARQIYPEKVGASIRQAAFDKRSAFRAESAANYDEALKLPGGRDRVFETPGLAADAKKLIDSMPQKTDIANEIAYDSYGNPISKLVSTKTPSKEFVPDNVVGKLKELAANPKEQRSLQDLISMRSEVDNAIAEGEAIPGRQTKYLTSIRETISNAIEAATKDQPALKAAFKKANDFYKKNVGKFHDKYIARLFRDIEQGGGFINDEDIVRNIGPTEYASLKQFLGAGSPEFAALKRGIVDEFYNSSLLPGEQLIKGDALIKNLSNFYKKNRSVAEDVLGPHAPTLQRLGEVLNSLESKVDVEALRQLVRRGDPLAPGIERLVREQAKLDKLYRSDILKAIGEGKLGDNFNASDFVNRFFDTASPKEIQSVVSQLADNPEVLENLRRKLIQKVLFEAQRRSTVADPVSMGIGDPLLPPNSDSLRQAVGSMDKRGNLEMILGRDTMNQLADLSKVVRGSEMTERAFKAAGGLIAGSQLSTMLRGGVLSYASDYVKQRFASMVLASSLLRKWVSNATMTAPLVIGGKELAKTKEGALITTLIGSTPFLEAVADEFGQGTAAEQFLQALRRSVNMWENQGTATKTNQLSAAQLLDNRIRQK